MGLALDFIEDGVDRQGVVALNILETDRGGTSFDGGEQGRREDRGPDLSARLT